MLTLVDFFDTAKMISVCSSQGLTMSFMKIIKMLLFMPIVTVYASSADLQQMLTKIEEDTLALAHKVEELILDKCNFTSDETCYKSSYHSCNSELPYAECPGNEYSIKECGSQKSGCGGLFDFTTSVVSVAPDSSDPTNDGTELNNDRIRDGVCSTLRLEDYMKQVTESSRSYWASLDVFPPWLYYGTDDG